MHLSSRAALIGFFFTTATTAALGIQGCATRSDDVGTVVGEHNEGEPIVANDTHVWAESPAEDFDKGMTSPNGDRPVAKDDVVTQRVQAWLDRYHVIVGEVMREHGEVLRAPKPTAALFKQYAPNAWVSSAWACPNWTVRLTGGQTGDHVALTPDVAASTNLGDRCTTPVNWTDPQAFASFYNGQGNACQVTASGTTLSVTGCQTSGTTAPLATYAVSTTVSVTLDAITWGEELRVAQTLAHELGHYYRAHSNPSVKKHINFFYRDTPNGPDRPVSALESSQYESIVNQIRNSPKPISIKPKTRYNKRLAATLYSIRSFCPTARMTEANMRGVMSGQITQGNTSAYVSFETAFATCAKGVAYDQTLSSQLASVLRQNRIYAKVDPNAQTLDEAMVSLSATYDEVDRQEALLVKQMTDGQFGWYTDEQEADEMGLELATRAGFKPEDVINASLRTYEQLDALYARAGIDRDGEIPMTTCKKWLASNFTEKDADGNKTAVHVPIGSLSDTHHEGCYRIYNLWREAKRHNYKVADALPELSPTWSEIQAHAATLGGSKPPVVSNDGGGSGPDGSSGDDDSEFDPEESAPPPRKPKAPVVVSDADAGAPATMTYTRETGGCSVSTTTSTSSPASGLAALLGLTLLVRRRVRARSRAHAER